MSIEVEAPRVIDLPTDLRSIEISTDVDSFYMGAIANLTRPQLVLESERGIFEHTISDEHLLVSSLSSRKSHAAIFLPLGYDQITNYNVSNKGATTVIEAIRTQALRINSHAGSVALAGVRIENPTSWSPATIQTQSGAVHLIGGQAPVWDVYTGTGDITIAETKEKVKHKTMSGNISILDLDEPIDETDQEYAPLQKMTWATCLEGGLLRVTDEERPIQMAKSQGTARELIVLASRLGCDEIRFAKGEGVDTHVHEGDHILVATQGEGILEYAGKNYRLRAGDIYGVPGMVPHAIWARKKGLVLLSIGNQRVPPGSNERLRLMTEQAAHISTIDPFTAFSRFAGLPARTGSAAINAMIIHQDRNGRSVPRAA